MGKVEGEAEGCRCDTLSFNLMLVCYLFVHLFSFFVVVCFFLSLFLSLCVRFLLLHLKEQLQCGWNIRSCLFVFVCSSRPIV